VAPEATPRPADVSETAAPPSEREVEASAGVGTDAGPGLAPDEKLAALDAVVAALAHPARRQILLTIQFRGAATAGEIAGRFAHRWPTTTRHLHVLEDAGLIRHEKRGRSRVYTVDKQRLALVNEWLSWFELPKAGG
jgi:DNA-binding transcriptional ArsR family regulator